MRRGEAATVGMRLIVRGGGEKRAMVDSAPPGSACLTLKPPSERGSAHKARDPASTGPASGGTVAYVFAPSAVAGATPAMAATTRTSRPRPMITTTLSEREGFAAWSYLVASIRVDTLPIAEPSARRPTANRAVGPPG